VEAGAREASYGHAQSEVQLPPAKPPSLGIHASVEEGYYPDAPLERWEAREAEQTSTVSYAVDIGQGRREGEGAELDYGEQMSHDGHEDAAAEGVD